MRRAAPGTACAWPGPARRPRCSALSSSIVVTTAWSKTSVLLSTRLISPMRPDPRQHNVGHYPGSVIELISRLESTSLLYAMRPSSGVAPELGRLARVRSIVTFDKFLLWYIIIYKNHGQDNHYFSRILD